MYSIGSFPSFMMDMTTNIILDYNHKLSRNTSTMSVTPQAKAINEDPADEEQEPLKPK